MYPFPPTLQNTLPYPGVYEEAARLVKTGVEDYCCHAISRAIIGHVGDNYYTRRLNFLYQDQFRIGFGDSEFWDKPFTLVRSKARVQALLNMAKLCKPKKE